MKTIIAFFVMLAMGGLCISGCGDSATVDAAPMERAGNSPAAASQGEVKMEKATFGAGCFWGVESTFRAVPGVIDTAVGYSGGTTKNPAYKDVCAGNTGHAESVEVTYDPGKVSYEQLLQVFWENHNPTTMNRQGPDFGAQYRSVIFYHTPQQQAAAEESKEALDQSGKFNNPIVTQIVPAAPFYRAEEYHQRYHEKHGLRKCNTP